MLLAGDIGGTKVNLALFDVATGPHAPAAEMTFASRDYAGLEAIVAEYLAHHPNVTIEAACFGAAGPVLGGRARITNLPWTIDETLLARDCNIPRVRLINDLVATASAVPILEADDVLVLNPGNPIPTTSIAVIAPGTGLGEAYLTWDGGQYRAFPSEGGHVGFAPTDDLQIGLLRFLLPRYNGHVSAERVASGIGIPNIYDFLKMTEYAADSGAITDHIDGKKDRTRAIFENALGTEPHPLCTKTLEMFVAILGAQAGDLALALLATGGVYLGGGIPPRILPLLQSDLFRNAYLNKGRFRDMLEQIPLFVILSPKTALFGAARVGMTLID